MDTMEKIVTVNTSCSVYTASHCDMDLSTNIMQTEETEPTEKADVIESSFATQADSISKSQFKYVEKDIIASNSEHSNDAKDHVKTHVQENDKTEHNQHTPAKLFETDVITESSEVLKIYETERMGRDSDTLHGDITNTNHTSDTKEKVDCGRAYLTTEPPKSFSAKQRKKWLAFKKKLHSKYGTTGAISGVEETPENVFNEDIQCSNLEGSKSEIYQQEKIYQSMEDKHHSGARKVAATAATGVHKFLQLMNLLDKNPEKCKNWLQHQDLQKKKLGDKYKEPVIYSIVKQISLGQDSSSSTEKSVLNIKNPLDLLNVLYLNPDKCKVWLKNQEELRKQQGKNYQQPDILATVKLISITHAESTLAAEGENGTKGKAQPSAALKAQDQSFIKENEPKIPTVMQMPVMDKNCGRLEAKFYCRQTKFTTPKKNIPMKKGNASGNWSKTDTLEDNCLQNTIKSTDKTHESANTSVNKEPGYIYVLFPPTVERHMIAKIISTQTKLDRLMGSKYRLPKFGQDGRKLPFYTITDNARTVVLIPWVFKRKKYSRIITFRNDLSDSDALKWIENMVCLLQNNDPLYKETLFSSDAQVPDPICNETPVSPLVELSDPSNPYYVQSEAYPPVNAYNQDNYNYDQEFSIGCYGAPGYGYSEPLQQFFPPVPRCYQSAPNYGNPQGDFEPDPAMGCFPSVNMDSVFNPPPPGTCMPLPPAPIDNVSIYPSENNPYVEIDKIQEHDNIELVVMEISSTPEPSPPGTSDNASHVTHDTVEQCKTTSNGKKSDNSEIKSPKSSISNNAVNSSTKDKETKSITEMKRAHFPFDNHKNKESSPTKSEKKNEDVPLYNRKGKETKLIKQEKKNEDYSPKYFEDNKRKIITEEKKESRISFETCRNEEIDSLKEANQEDFSLDNCEENIAFHFKGKRVYYPYSVKDSYSRMKWVKNQKKVYIKKGNLYTPPDFDKNGKLMLPNIECEVYTSAPEKLSNDLDHLKDIIPQQANDAIIKSNNENNKTKGFSKFGIRLNPPLYDLCKEEQTSKATGRGKKKSKISMTAFFTATPKIQPPPEKVKIEVKLKKDKTPAKKEKRESKIKISSSKESICTSIRGTHHKSLNKSTIPPLPASAAAPLPVPPPTTSEPERAHGKSKLSAFERLGPPVEAKKPKLTINLIADEESKEVTRRVVEEHNPVYLRQDILTSKDLIVRQYRKIWPWSKPVKVVKECSSRSLDPVLDEIEMAQCYASKSAWVKVMATGYPAHFNKEDVLDFLLDFVKDKEFVPCFVEFKPEECVFLLNRCEQALTYLHQKGLIVKKGDVQINLTVSQTNLTLDNLRFYKGAIFKTKVQALYDEEFKSINLSAFQMQKDNSYFMYFPLNVPRNQLLIMDVIKVLLPWRDVTTLDLSANRLANLSFLNLSDYFPSLRILDLSDNLLASVSTLACFKGIPMYSLKLEGNPLCQNFIHPDDYIDVVKLVFPRLLVLDGVKVDSRRDIKRNFSVSPTAVELVNTFLDIYFALIESNDRTQLESLYSDKAVFSITCRPEMKRNVLYCNMREFYMWCRTLNACINANDPLEGTIVGGAKIVRYFTKWPLIIHDPKTFTVDIFLHTEKTTTFKVTGLFKIPAESLNQDEPVTEFSRTFILATEDGCEYKILNDMMYISEATQERLNTAFQAVGFHQLCNDSIALKFDTLPDDEIKDRLIEIFMKVTNLPRKASTRCLDTMNWNVKKALEYFIRIEKADSTSSLFA